SRRATAKAANARVVNHGSQEWPVLISSPETRRIGRWKVIVALAIVFAVTAGSTLYYLLMVKPKRAAARQEVAAKTNAPPSASPPTSQAPKGAQTPPTPTPRRAPPASPATASSSQTPAASQPAANPEPAAGTSNPTKPNPVAATPAGAEAAVAANDAGARYALQAASFPNAAAAGEFVSKLVRAGVPAYVVSAEIPKRGRWYRVRVGRFSTPDDANRFANDAKLRARSAGITLPLVLCDYEKPDR